MSFRKILIALVFLYLVAIHIFLFTTYFEKVELGNPSWPILYTVISEYDREIFSETKGVLFSEFEVDESITLRKRSTLDIYGDSIAVITHFHINYNPVIFFSNENRSFFGHPSSSFIRSELYLKRGNCLIGYYSKIDEYTDSTKAAEMREWYDGRGCEFKNYDAPYDVYILEKIHKGIKLFPG